MTWMLTASGGTVNLRCIGVSALDIGAIAQSLSLINRFVGHTIRPISEAEHALNVAEVLRRDFGVTDPAVLTAGLLNNAYKTLSGDISAGMKDLLGVAWSLEKVRIQQSVLRQLGFWVAHNTNKQLIEDASEHVKSAEREQLMYQDGDMWPCQVTHPAPAWLRLGSERSPNQWRQAYLECFNHHRDQLRAAFEAIPVYQPATPQA